MSFTMAELAEATSGRLVGRGDTVIERLVTDSRQAGPGALFVALSGEATDGHLFVADAVAAGASGLLICEPQGRPGPPQVVVPDTKRALVDFTRGRLSAQGVRVVGVTGSVGKTTTKEMVAAVAARKFEVLKTEGNLNTYTGLAMNVARLAPGTEVFVAEYGMSAKGEIALLAEMAPPDIAVVLNVGLNHVEFLGSIEGVAAAKRELVEALGPQGAAVLNADDERVAAMASAAPGRVIYFSASGDPRAEVRADDISLGGLGGSTFVLSMPDGQARVRLRLAGRHAVLDGLAAAAVGYLLGVAVAEVAMALESCSPSAGRMLLRPGRRGSTIIDDAYNASPSSMEAALAVLLAEPPPRIAVLGDMLELGAEAAEAHRRVGRAAAGADLLVAVGGHAGEIGEGAAAAGLPKESFAVAAGAAEAVALVEPRLDGAVVLVKASRGMALEAVVEALVA